MNLERILKEQYVLTGKNYATKKEVLEAIVAYLVEIGAVADAEAVLKAIYDRETVGPTGLDNGIAIPHGKVKGLQEPIVCIIKNDNAITDWENIVEGNTIDTIILLLVPQGANDEHLKILSAISTKLATNKNVEALKALENPKEIIAFFQPEKKEKVAQSVGASKVLAVTACATGIAHTFMAAASLEDAAEEMGITIRTEKQGASGIEDRFTQAEIDAADVIIFATDVAVKEKYRFNGKQFIQVKVAEPLKNAPGILTKALTSPDGTVNESEEQISTNTSLSFWQKIYQGVLTGLSYMIPILVGAGLLTGIAKLIAMTMGITDIIGDYEAITAMNNGFVSFLFYMDKFGGLLLQFIYPIFSMYVAYAIADRSALMPGFAGGIMASGIHGTIWGIKIIPSGFLGALILGIAAGLLVEFLNKNIKVSKNLQAIKPMFLIPGISILCVLILNYVAVEPLFGWINMSLQNLIRSAEAAGEYTLAAIIAALTAFDLGGPVNKAAGAVAIPLAAEMVFPLTPRVISIVVPPIGLGLATVLDKFIVGKRVFPKDLQVTGNTSLVLGFLAVSEGAIPFMLQNPFITIPINIIGAIAGSWIAMALGAVQWLPLPAIWGWPLATNPLGYVIGVLSGALIIALLNIFVRAYLLKKGKTTLES